MASLVHHGEDDDPSRLDDEKDRVREAPEERSAGVILDDGKREGHCHHTIQGPLNLAQELAAETLLAILVPTKGLSEIPLGLPL